MSDAEKNFEAFSRIVDDLHATWTMWQELFGEEARSETHNVLVSASPDVFKYVRWHWLVSVTLELAKLDDRDQMYGRDNLTIQRIFNETDYANDEQRHVAQTVMDFALAKIQRDEFKKFRNRIIAHNDLLAVTGIENPMGDMSIEPLYATVYAVRSFRDRIAAIRKGEPINIATGENYYPSPEDDKRWHNDVRRLVSLLSAGLDAEQNG